MSVSVPPPGELAHRLEAEAARRGMTREQLAAEVIRDHLPADGRSGEAAESLEAFFGIGESSDEEPFDLKRIGREAADRKLCERD